MKRHSHPPRLGFTLVELLVSMAIFTLVMVLFFQMISSSSNVLTSARSKISAFEDARRAFETVTHKLGEATLNTYLGYYQGNQALTSANSATFTPDNYARTSELHFISGLGTNLIPSTYTSNSNGGSTQSQAVFFQAPLGYTSQTNPLRQALNATGYFLSYTDVNADRPVFVPANPVKRWCLMEIWQPTEEMTVYSSLNTASYSTTYKKWFTNIFDNQIASPPIPRIHLVAENIIALAIWPRRELSSPANSLICQNDYTYDTRAFSNGNTDAVSTRTRNQLPPVVQVTLVAIDETSAARLQAKYSGPTATTKLPFTPGLFQSLGSGATVAEQEIALKSDLATLEQRLIAEHASYRVFSTSITIRQAKWSE